MLEQLSRPFPPQHVKTRQQAGQTLYYVSIDHVIQRFNEVLGMNWSSEIKEITTKQTGTDKKDRPIWTSWCRTAITIRHDDGTTTTREGVGAASNFSEDTSYKASSSEAFKKCAQNFNLALELFNPARRAFCAHLSGWENMEPDLLKMQLGKAVNQWRNEDATLSSFASKQDANRAFLEEASLTKDEITDIKQRCMGINHAVAA